MHPNAALLTRFYTAFQQKDYATMQGCYADNAVFNDEAFRNLDAAQVRSMWEMLLKNGKDLRLEFHNVQADDVRGSAEWVATYTFSRTRRRVVNRIRADFELENGKIVRHTDHFNFYRWSRQALGTPGLLLGWTGFLRRKVQTTAMASLADFMQKNG